MRSWSRRDPFWLSTGRVDTVLVNVRIDAGPGGARRWRSQRSSGWGPDWLQCAYWRSRWERRPMLTGQLGRYRRPGMVIYVVSPPTHDRVVYRWRLELDVESFRPS